MLQGNTSVRGLKELLEEYERSLIVSALEGTGGHQRRAAQILGVLPTTLHEKMKRLGLRPRHSHHGTDAEYGAA
jgi:DNA-binding NtrC family response regulator